MKITKKRLRQIITEEVQKADPKLLSAIDELTGTIRDLDLSVDYLSSAITGEVAYSVGYAQSLGGRTANPERRGQSSVKELEDLVREEVAAIVEEFGDDSPFRMRDMIPPKVRGKFKDTFYKVPGAPTTHGRGKPSARAKAAWEAAGGELSIFDKQAIAKFLEDAGLKISLEKYMDNIKYAVKGDRLGRRIVSLVDAMALANRTGTRRGHLRKDLTRDPKRRAPEFTRESKAAIEKMIEEEIESIMSEDDDWIQKAVDPDHEGYCTPMTKKTCTPARKALAKRFKKAAKKKDKEGGTGWQGKV